MAQESEAARLARLAKQYGGTVESTATPTTPEMTALAAQHGGTATPATPASPAPERGLLSAILDYAKAAVTGDLIGINVASQNVLRSNPQDLLPAAGGTVGGVLASPGIATAAGGAALGGAAGSAVKQLIDRAVGRPAPSSATDAALAIAGEGAVQGAVEGAGGLVTRAAAPVVNRVGRRLMQSALKPTAGHLKDVTPAGVPQVVQTMLDEGVPVTRAGYDRLQTLLTQAGQDVDAALVGRRGNVFPEAVAQRAADLKSQLGIQVTPRRDQMSVQKAMDEFLDVYRGGPTYPATPMTLGQAQAVKQGTYRQINSAYGEQGATLIEAQKALARGLREDIERHVPEVGPLNARVGRLADADTALERRLGYADNRDIAGITTTASHRAAAFIGALIDRSAAVKSLLALGLYDAAARAAKVPENVLRLAMQAVANTPDDAPPSEVNR